VGAGIKYAVFPHMVVSLHAMYADMGKVDSSTAGSSTTLETPLTVNMRTQNYFVGFTYVM
jgi:opacity protein-like surface antigen